MDYSNLFKNDRELTTNLLRDFFDEAMSHGVFVCCEKIDRCEGILADVEFDYIKHATPKRKNEFVAGRIAAKNSLEILGYNSFPILVGDMREPIWPHDVSGSITHDGNYCIASVANKNEIEWLGIDLTTNQPLNHGLVDMICSEEEIFRISSELNVCDADHLYKLIFSIKESVYKCLFPLVKKIFDFHDVVVLIDTKTGSVSISLNNKRIFSDINLSLNAAYCFVGNYIFSVVWSE